MYRRCTEDRTAIEPIIRLTSPDVLKMLSQSKQKAVHALIPEKFRPIDSNKVGLYPHPISICLGPNTMTTPLMTMILY